MVLLEAAKVGAAAVAAAVVKAPAEASRSSSSAASASAAAAAAGHPGKARHAATACADEAHHLEGPLHGQELGPDRGAVQRGDAVVGGAPCFFLGGVVVVVVGREREGKEGKKVSCEFFLFPDDLKPPGKEKKKRKRLLTVGELAEGVPLRVARDLIHDQVERREPAVGRQQPLDAVGFPVARQAADEDLVRPVGDRRADGAEPRGVDARVRVGGPEQRRGGGVVVVGPADAEPGAAEGDACRFFVRAGKGREKGKRVSLSCFLGRKKTRRENLERKESFKNSLLSPSSAIAFDASSTDRNSRKA